MNIKLISIAVFVLLGRIAFCDEINDAAREGDLAKVKALLKENPDLVSSAFFDGWTPLDEAANNGYYEMAKVLVVNKADVNLKAKGGRSPLYFAVMYDHADIVKLLLESGANSNVKDENGVTPLHLAAWSGYEDEAKLLLAHEADATAKDHSGETPLDWAMKRGNKEVVTLLQR
jgi:uncharacterized protein